MVNSTFHKDQPKNTSFLKILAISLIFTAIISSAFVVKKENIAKYVIKPLVGITTEFFKALEKDEVETKEDNGIIDDIEKDEVNIEATAESNIIITIQPEKKATPIITIKPTIKYQIPLEPTYSYPTIAPGAPGSKEWEEEFQRKFDEMSKKNSEMQKQVEDAQKKFCEENPSLCNK